MAHTNIYANGDIAISGQAGEGYTNINDARLDTGERLAVQHHHEDSASDDNDGRDTDGMHIAGQVSAVENQTSAANITGAGGIGVGVLGTAVNGSSAMAEDTHVLYIKKGPVEAAGGTWTAIATNRELGSWANVTVDSTDTATASGFVVATLTVGSGERSSIIGKTDGNETPTTVRAYASCTWITDKIPSASFCMPVKKDDQYLVTLSDEIGTGDATAYFIPLTV